jgi:predicted ribosome quality control (RQC) complex YloA/Tae2 family protein
MINDKFCDLEKRELQNKIDSLLADNALLRSNANNERQTVLINERFNEIQNQLTAIKSTQPNTVPVQWPSIQAVNTTPNISGWYGWNNGWGSNSFWN